MQTNSQFEEFNLIKRLLQACIREHLLSYFVSDKLFLITFKKSQKILILENVQQFSLGRMKMNSNVILLADLTQIVPVTSIAQLLNLIEKELQDEIHLLQWNRFVQEVLNCVKNAVLIENFVQQFNPMLENKIYPQSFLSYIKSLNPAEQILFFERWAMKGHPYHPCHKTKLGFSKEEYLKFSPEFHEDIDLPLAAIEKSCMEVSSQEEAFDYSQWVAVNFPDQWNEWSNQMKLQGLKADYFYPIFIHTWQYEHIIQTTFSSLIEKNKLILFPKIHLKTKASLSFRTLMTNKVHQPHIKLPIGVHSTSAIRTVSPASVHNGPRLSRLLQLILKLEQHFNSHLQVASELCGLHLQHEPVDVAKHLGIIYRQNPASLISKQHIPIVVAALFEKTPSKPHSLFIEIMIASGNESLNDAKHYFKNYCQVVLQAFFDLFLIYGIALEGHQQNTLAVFEKDFPVFMIIRDLGGVRIHTPALKEHELVFNAYPNSATVTENYEEVIHKFIHTVLQYHLGELVLMLSEYFQGSESIFWQIIKSQLENRFEVLKSRVNPTRWHQAYQSIMQEDWKLKGLMRMRLTNVYSQYLYIPISNPLREM